MESLLQSFGDAHKSLGVTINPKETKEFRFIISAPQHDRYLCQVIHLKSGRLLYNATTRHHDPGTEGIMNDSQLTFKNYESILEGSSCFCSIFPQQNELPPSGPTWLSVALHNPFTYSPVEVEYNSETVSCTDSTKAKQEVQTWLHQIGMGRCQTEFFFLLERPKYEFNTLPVQDCGNGNIQDQIRNINRVRSIGEMSGSAIGFLVGILGTAAFTKGLNDPTKTICYVFSAVFGVIGGFFGGGVITEKVGLLPRSKNRN